ncbi:unnamed protein product [Microthlaspi erraticum]|uniref:F-box domain-containing protein n=1 Tax=Microthlaspi erraticum TaxID=1685480 RepID=A0A6D2LJ12_9BRAS|nr:unnamed protein product [Microthlaspi erraticum]
MDSTPKDLLMEIFSRLPAKSVGRFRCVSKRWSSMLRRPYFTELFLTRSRACPRLLFAIKGDRKGEWKFFSSSQPQMSSSLVVATGFQFKFFDDMKSDFCGYASGLICFCVTTFSEENENRVHVISNPSTGQYAILPKLGEHRSTRNFLGFDPIDKQFKILSMVAKPSCDHDHRILSLGTGKMNWRKIQCPFTHKPSPFRGICINGVIYYLASFDQTSYVIICFDVRSEKFKFIDIECFHDKLINYKGKLGVIQWKCVGDDSSIELTMVVLEDVEKREWSKHVYILPDDIKIVNWNLISIAGVTALGEIVLSINPISKPFYVFYYNPERNDLRCVEIQGFGENHGRVKVIVDHVEDLNVNDAKILKSSISAPYAKRKRSLNMTRKKRKGDGHEV